MSRMHYDSRAPFDRGLIYYWALDLCVCLVMPFEWAHPSHVSQLQYIYRVPLKRIDELEQKINELGKLAIH